MGTTGFFITATDTDVGKTVVSAWLTHHLKACYFKPIQTGSAGGDSDTQTVLSLLEPLDKDKAKNKGKENEQNESVVLPPAIVLGIPQDPWTAALNEGKTLTLKDLPSLEALEKQSDLAAASSETLTSRRPLIIEGAGGLMVPLNAKETMLDVMRFYGLEIIVVAKTALGTINHTLLTLEKLKQEGLLVRGIVLNGPVSEPAKRSLETFSSVPILAELPTFSPLSSQALKDFPCPIAL